MGEKTVEKFAKGRVSLSAKLVKEANVEEGDAFIAEADKGKITLTKINADTINKK